MTDIKRPDNRIGLFCDISRKMAIVYGAKNRDYGNSYAKLRKTYPESILIRLSDKINRLEVLLRSGSSKVPESIEDTLLDIANYAVMELVERRIDKEENNAD